MTTNESSVAGPVVSTPNPALNQDKQLQPSRMPVQSARISHHELDGVQRMGRLLAASQYFADARDVAQAAVKIMAGQELGIPPIAAMMGIHVIKGKIVLSGNLIASRIRAHGYDFRHKRFDGTGCVLEFLGKLEAGKRTVLGESAFTEEDARAAGCYGDMYKKYPRNMYFNRALSNGAKWFTPEVFAGAPVYVAEELGARVDENGDMIDAPKVIPMQPPVTVAPELPSPSIASLAAEANRWKRKPRKPAKVETPAAPVVAIIEGLPEFEYVEIEPPSLEEQLEISLRAVAHQGFRNRAGGDPVTRLAQWLRFAVHGEYVRRPRQRRRLYRGPARDESYKAWIRRQPCCCGCGRGPCDAAHTGPHGLGQKAADTTCIPLWWTCHALMHRIGQEEFERRNGICIEYIIEGLNIQFSSAQ